MKKIFQIVKCVVLSWGLAALAIAVGSLFRPDRVDARLLRILLLELTVATAGGYLIFDAKDRIAGFWTRRIIVMLFSAAAGISVIVLAGLHPFTWGLCAWMFGGCAAGSALAFFAADRIEARTLEKINRRLEQNR